MRITLLACVTVLCAGVAVAQGSPTPRFQGLGRLPECQESRATAVSGDGSVVVGYCTESTSIQWAFAWTADGGMVKLVGIAGQHDYANAVSADGSLIVGTTTAWSGERVACRWTRAGNAWWESGLSQGDYAMPANSYAYGISSDGRVIVGYGYNRYPAVIEAFRWEDGLGVAFLGDLPGGPVRSYGWGVSGNGAVVVGQSMSTAGDEAFRWTASQGMTGLGDLPGGVFTSDAYAISGDGRVVVGEGCLTVGGEAFRWTSEAGMVGLGNLWAEGHHSSAKAVSADGRIVVGWSTTQLGGEAFLWDELNGMRNLRDVLVQDCGLNLTGWTLARASGISADGMTVVGWGYDPSGNIEGWVATLPEPATLSLLALGGALALLRRSSASAYRHRQRRRMMALGGVALLRCRRVGSV